VLHFCRLENCRSGTGAADRGDGAAVLRPAGDVVANRDRTLLAVGNGFQALGGNTPGDEEVAGGGGAAGAERQIVFARAALVGMAFDDDGILPVLVQPLRLARKRRLRVGADRGRIRVEEDAVADVDGEVLGRSGRCRNATSAIIAGFLVSAAIRPMPPLLRNSSDFVDRPVTTFGLTGVQETRLKFGFGCRPQPFAQGHPRGQQCARTVGGNAAKTRPRRGNGPKTPAYPGSLQTCN
jgi:hypothetical protein